MPYKSLPLGAFWTIFGRNFPTGVLQLLYPYQPANPLVESIFKALKFSKFLKFSSYIWATERIIFSYFVCSFCRDLLVFPSLFPEIEEEDPIFPSFS